MVFNTVKMRSSHSSELVTDRGRNTGAKAFNKGWR